jgi:anti-sigma regulatory factor (Ser/Thr protein kinase)
LARFLLRDRGVVKFDGPLCQVRVPIDSDSDIVVARQKGRALAAELGFSPADVVRIATAISELARNRASVEWATAKAVATGNCDSGDECSGHEDRLVARARDRGARR